MRFLLINVLVLASFMQLKAQKSAIAKPAAPAGNGYNIPITLQPLKNCTIYIGSYFGKSMTLVDSTRLDANSKGVFKGNKKLTGGIYFVVSPNYTLQFEVLMDEKQQFSITGDTANKEKAFTTGSIDNELFKEYTVVSTEKGKNRQQLESEYKSAKSKEDSTRYREQLIKLEKEMEAYRAEIIKKHPTSLLTTLFNTMKRPTAPAIPVVNGKADSLYPYRFVKDHYWDEVEFNDNRLLRTPFFEPKLDEYFKYFVSPDPDSIIAEVNYMLLSARSGTEIYPYLLTKFTNKYINPEYMGQDRVFVYLFENYYAKGDTILLNPSSRKTITDRAYSLMANQLGLPAPALNLVDTAGKSISLYSIKSSFTLVAFWDPTCGHCKEEVPQIDSIYQAKWKALGVSIFSVNVNEKEVPAWKKFIRDKNLPKTWIHAHQLKEDRQAEERAGKPNFRQLYDIFKTPTLYLLDADKRIIAKQLSLQQFDNIITVKLKK